MRSAEECNTGVPVPCPTFVKGWGSNPLQCTKYANTRPQECAADATCLATAPLCEAMAGVTGSAPHLQPCTDAVCKLACTPGTSVAVLAQNGICRVGAHAPCPDISCTPYLAGWTGVACERWTLDHTGTCESVGAVHGRCSTNRANCATFGGQTRTPLQSCGSTGCRRPSSCVPEALASTVTAREDVCIVDAVAGGCPPIQCSSALKGWNGRRCERYSANASGYCNASATCTTALTLCEMLAPAGVMVHECGSQSCRRPTTCQALAAVPAAKADVCFLDLATDACPDLACDTTVAGWNGNICRRFSKIHSGYCTADGTCDTALARCATAEAAAAPNNIAMVKVAECGSAQCKKPNACVPLSPLSSSDAISKVCTVDADNQQCPAVTCSSRELFVHFACID